MVTPGNPVVGVWLSRHSCKFGTFQKKTLEGNSFRIKPVYIAGGPWWYPVHQNPSFSAAKKGCPDSPVTKVGSQPGVIAVQLFAPVTVFLFS